MTVEQLDETRGMCQHQLNGLLFVGIIGIGREPPEAALAQGQPLELPVGIQAP